MLVPGGSAVRIPSLRGVLSTRDADLDAVARDFGNRVHHRPLAVLRPADPADVAAVVRFGRDCGLAVVPRGAGHSVDGQAQAKDGIVVDLSSLAAVHELGPDWIRVEAGARWSAVVAATLPCGLAPPVLPDYLELSVGGTLSVGGLGGASHQYGCVADNVLELEVVTPEGTLLTCSPTRNAELFDAVRASQGQHGIMTGVTLALTEARSTARRYLLGYRDLGAFLADQQRLTEDRRFDHVAGQARHEGPGWLFVLEAMKAFVPPNEPDDRDLLDHLAYQRGTEVIETTGYEAFLQRLAPFEASMRALGSWQRHPHPRCNVLLPGRHAEVIISETLDNLPPEDLGVGGSVLIYPVPTACLAAPRMPKAHDATTVLFGVQRTAPPGDRAALDHMRRSNAALRMRAQRAGGASYSPPR
ncbi:FAD-linked oxidase [Streptomyces cahuitamycinicus]|uniref:FAD-linked oxidase n=1 Tax=Streptomyces cahuitamycinicus TaxID=2070367 RepID=A0A2N8TXZ2_9ACTN|nr:FAD-linked oxidase [Streptomyces cahuitamycinicus]